MDELNKKVLDGILHTRLDVGLSTKGKTYTVRYFATDQSAVYNGPITVTNAHILPLFRSIEAAGAHLAYCRARNIPAHSWPERSNAKH